MSLLVAGSLALDDIDTPFGHKKGLLGGSACYFSIASSILYKTSILGTIGFDFPKKYLDFLKSCNIDLSGVSRSSVNTFHWKGFYEYDMNVAHTKETKLGAFASFNPILTEEQRNASYVFLGNIDPDIQLNIFNQLKKPKLVALDTMNFWISSKYKKLWKIIKKVDIMFINDKEAQILTHEDSLFKAAKKIATKGPKLVLIKKGEHGILLFYKKNTFILPAYPVPNVKDPTGAGDTFAGAFLSFLLANTIESSSLFNFDIIKQAVAWGVAVASIVVEDFSYTSIKKASVRSIKKRCEELHNYVYFQTI